MVNISFGGNSMNNKKDDNEKSSKTFLWLIVLAVVIIVSIMTNSHDSTYERKDSDFDWSDPEDVGDFLEWKEDNGSGWSNN